MELVREHRRVLGAGQYVIHVRAGQQLALFVVDRVLAQCLANALHDPAMRLAVDQQRIDYRAEIVDERITDDLDHTGLGVDLDFRDMAAVRERGGRPVGNELHIEALRQFRRQLQAGADLFGQFHDADRAIGAGDHKPAGAEFDVRDRRLQHMCGDLLAGLDDLVAGGDDRGAARHHRFRAAGAAAGDQLVAVALQQADLIERDAQTRAEHLRKRRCVALPVIQCAGDDRDGAVRLEADAAHFAARRSGQFEVVADAPPTQSAARPAFRLARGKPVPIGERQGLVQQVGKVAAVVGRAVRGVIGHRLGRDMVAPAQFDPVDPHFCRGGVHQPLHVIVGLGSAGAAIGADRGRVCEHAFCRDFDQRGLVDAERVSDRIAGRRAGRAVSRAEIAEDGEPHRQKMAVAVERQFGCRLGIAAMRVGQKAARAVVGPFDRAAEFARRVHDAVIFGIGRLFHAEGPADAIGYDAQLVAPDPEHAGDVIAEPEHTLARDMESPVLAFDVVLGNSRARLHRIDDDAVVAQLEPGNMRSRGERGGDLLAVSIVEIEPDIPGHIIIEKRRAGGGRLPG